MTQPVATVHVVDDDESFRTAILRLLTIAGYQARGYISCSDFLLNQQDSGLGCLILDVRMPGPSGLELQATLSQQNRSLPIIFLTGHGDIPMSVRAMKAGAVDFLTKPVQREHLLSAVNTALDHDARMRSIRDTLNSLQLRYRSLTLREQSVFALVVQGRLNKQIASELGIAERTVKAHRSQVMLKMQADSLAELVRIAEQMQLAGESH